jgi:pre-mRNA-splicing factor 18
MDLLQKELLRKKQALLANKAKSSNSHDNNDGSGKNKKRKYMRQGDLRRIEEEEEEEEEERRQQQEQAQELLKRQKIQQQHESSSSKSTKPRKKKKKDRTTKTSTTEVVLDDDSEKDGSKSKSSNKDENNSDASSSSSSAISITQQLRAFGLPIRYFGESHTQRLKRLEQALEQQSHVLQGLSEMEEFRLGKGHGIRNPFLEKDEKDKDGTGTNTTTKSSKEPSQGKEKEKEEDDHQNDPPKRIYKYFKGLLKEWEQDLSERPDSVARSVTGRNESKTLKQCKDYIRPLFKLLKQRKLSEGLQTHLLNIVNFAQAGEFVRAHDTYMDVAIGRAAWPIGVTMVGIHARSGRAKIESSKVAHVMNSELQRKYLTSVKRLLTFAQKKRPDVDPSKKVM